MSSQKDWYEPDADDEIRVIPRSHHELSYVSIRWHPPRVMPGIGECLLYPLVLPTFLSMLFSFALVFGFVLLYFGHVLVAGAVGENDHPRWPEWNSSDISEGIGRWVWGVLFGAEIILLPAFGCWKVLREGQLA